MQSPLLRQPPRLLLSRPLLHIRSKHTTTPAPNFPEPPLTVSTTSAPHYGDIVTLTINHQPTRNALSRHLTKSLLDSLTTLPDTTRALILASSIPKVFCAGADLRERLTFTEADTLAFLGLLNRTVDTFASLPFPTIAAIGGAALGGGLEIALAADLRVAGKAATLGLPETRIGVIPGAGGTWRLPPIVGRGRALEMMMTGRRVGAEEAWMWGLVNRLTEEGAEVEGALELAKECCEGAPRAVEAVKKVVSGGRGGGADGDGRGREMEGYLEILRTKDRTEALERFVKKEKVVWKGV
ncbi:ClpP/crotonase [Ascodesmis nigricans]|uniref:ClpP/crotonase n=1 Tax=Ascodesmis nigricans TaxID=341454 RepID=A0A4S2N1H0_9PEZI|nr:ClpP/crotonase [Ascodesmis nigricans]